MIHALLTIDDIASRNTPAIVDYLNEKGIPALLFAWGQNVEQYFDQAVYALQNGMIVGNHSYSHPHFSEISLAEGIREIEKCEEVLDKLYAAAGVPRAAKPFRFPYGDKGGKNKAALQEYLASQQFSKVRDSDILFPWWRENGLDRDIDTKWTFDFAEYNIRPGTGFTIEDVFNRIEDRNPSMGGALYTENAHHILLLHAHDETEEMAPGYYRQFIDRLLAMGVVFVKPEFIR